GRPFGFAGIWVMRHGKNAVDWPHAPSRRASEPAHDDDSRPNAGMRAYVERVLRVRTFAQARRRRATEARCSYTMSTQHDAVRLHRWQGIIDHNREAAPLEEGAHAGVERGAVRTDQRVTDPTRPECLACRTEHSEFRAMDVHLHQLQVRQAI